MLPLCSMMWSSENPIRLRPCGLLPEQQGSRWVKRRGMSHDRAAWLKIAEGWFSLLPRRQANTAGERFEDDATKLKTGQPDSDASH
jgi:hypothetical protein